tara:strand:+ start:249 stop:428 length:180 start_codon:yes stop_codon:yes gene_type:complete
MNKETSMAEADKLISEYVRKIREEQLDMKVAIEELFNNQNIKEYYDKEDIQLILTFEGS